MNTAIVTRYLVSEREVILVSTMIHQMEKIQIKLTEIKETASMTLLELSVAVFRSALTLTIHPYFHMTTSRSSISTMQIVASLSSYNIFSAATLFPGTITRPDIQIKT
jgi:hypothetical protein